MSRYNQNFDTTILHVILNSFIHLTARNVEKMNPATSTNTLKDGLPIGKSLSCLDQIVNQYHLKKRKISETEEARAASRKITRNKMNSRTEDQLVDIWSIVAPLNASDEKIVDNLRGKLEQIKKERLEY
ncbi:4353_t:CDS:2, partial [Racocetra fulgida]